MISNEGYSTFPCWWVLICTPCFFLVQSCAKTDFGKQLADSFDSPSDVSLIEVQTSSNKTNRNSVVPQPKKKKSTNPVSVKKEGNPEFTNYRNLSKQKKNNFVSQVVPSQPYRITIKLSRADPSAPAEVVTQALRLAGVVFEVEKIERIESRDLPQGRAERLGGARR